MLSRLWVYLPMTIQQLINDRVFNSAFLSVAIYGKGNKNRLSSIKAGTKPLTDRDKAKIKKYFAKKYKINFEE